MKKPARLQIEYIKKRVGRKKKLQWYVRFRRGKRILLHSEYYHNLNNARSMVQNLRASLTDLNYVERFLTPLEKDPEVVKLGAPLKKEAPSSLTPAEYWSSAFEH